MVISCGLILTDGKQLLLCHPTGNSFWNIPKGLADPGESHSDACKREVLEETGLVFRTDQLAPLGTFPYLSGKMLSLFCYKTGILPAVASLHCDSYFLDAKGRKLPEHDAFRYATWEEAEALVNAGLVPVLKTVRELIKS